MNGEIIHGFSRLSKDEKIACIAGLISDPEFTSEVALYTHPSKQEVFDSFSENTLTNYYLPFGIAPNFLINGKTYHIPMVIEESSVVAAASAAAKFWSARDGFHASVISSVKKGHVHFLWHSDPEKLTAAFPDLKKELLKDSESITVRMRERGGGITGIRLEDFSGKIEGYFRISVDFDTADSMGANFINTVLEAMAGTLRRFIQNTYPGEKDRLEIIMAILSNHVPECLVKCSVSCEVKDVGTTGEMPADIFVQKFKTAVDIALIDPYRAATHNKGIMNGIDAVVLATGNDFRAVEAGAHAYASKDGAYKSLSVADIKNGIFSFQLTIPMAIGTVGGLTTLHPLAKRAMQILGNPGARELMMVIAAAGLANNFSAVKALVSKGIQHGHMKMHLPNMLLPYNLNPEQKKQVEEYFRLKPVSYAAVADYIKQEFTK